MSSLTLYIPGLFCNSSFIAGELVPEFNALETLLARASRNPSYVTSYTGKLAQLTGLTSTAGQDIPVAAISRLMDAEERPAGVWMRADPIHLSAGTDGLFLTDSSKFSLSQHDALALAAEIRILLDELGWELEVPIPERWYIKLDGMPNVSTSDLSSAAGQEISNYLPAGTEGKKWHRVINELQMLLHASEVNQNRVASGELPVNSLWFWGIGELPDILQRYWTKIYSDDVFVNGLAMLSNTPCLPIPENADTLLSDNATEINSLVILNQCQAACNYRETANWIDNLAALENSWFKPLLDVLHSGSLDRLEIISDKTGYVLNRRSLAKFWRRSKSISTYQTDISH